MDVGVRDPGEEDGLWTFTDGETSDDAGLVAAFKRREPSTEASAMKTLDALLTGATLLGVAPASALVARRPIR